MKRMITGMVWAVSSGEAAREGAREIRQLQCNPGSELSQATALPRSDEQGHFIVLVGYGAMFSVEFLVECGRCVQKYEGSKVEREDLVSWAYNEWWKFYKQQYKEDQLLLNSRTKNGV